jgi:hypothetical protein
LPTIRSDLPPGFAVTLLGLADAGRCAVKTLTRSVDGSIASSDYDHGFVWWFKSFDAGANFDRMARALRRMAQAPRVILCMGVPKPGLNLAAPHQRLWARDDCSNTMIAVPRAWLAIDVDDAPVPPGLGNPDRYVEGAIFVRDTMLPEERWSAVHRRALDCADRRFCAAGCGSCSIGRMICRF